MVDQSLALEIFLKHTYEDIEKKIDEIITDQNILVILKGGKRLRPLLGAISFKACTGGNESSQLYQDFLEGAVAIELAHGASLVHDDIIDGDLTRRGEAAFYIKTGIDNAILIGHKMLVIGAKLALSHGEKIAQLYVDAWSGTLDGQLNEINFNSKDLQDITLTADSKFFQVYSRIIDLKTATLFSAACKAAAYWANASNEIADLLAEYGREVGFAYQLADDLVDLEKGEMIDSVVIPLLTRLEKRSAKNGNLKTRSIRKKINKKSPEIKKLYLEEISKHVNKAQMLCKSPILPNNQFKTFLLDAPFYSINKMLKEIFITI
ncbi:MAG: polyprenyl synthetase family protein [Thermoplasmata archaeon]|nr:polyprenyl synthetase family protein [Thermoplasmata archaeon]MBE3137106.1 polyprenyl synthetase family protein [Thermoplasmata archaeon]MBE3141663.1 polyprenyl synthetase family protein [Thermoplasmata archaeon]